VFVADTEILFAFDIVRHGARAPLGAVAGGSGPAKMTDRQKRKAERRQRKEEKRQKKEQEKQAAQAKGPPAASD